MLCYNYLPYSKPAVFCSLLSNTSAIPVTSYEDIRDFITVAGLVRCGKKETFLHCRISRQETVLEVFIIFL